jgi:hypothetical protein
MGIVQAQWLDSIGEQAMNAVVLPPWRRRTGLALSVLAALFFLLDATGKLLQIEPVMKGTLELGWPTSSVVPLGILLLIGAILYLVPRTAVIAAVYLTAFLGGAVATHYRIGSPLFTHVLFGVYVAAVMWGGVVLRYPQVWRAFTRPDAMGGQRQ